MEYRCVSACLWVCTYVYLYTRARGCVSRFQLKWRFMVFKLAHASRRGLLSGPHIGCCLCVFFIWINWSLVWKILLTNGAGRSWTAAYLLQFVRFIFSQPQPCDDFTLRKKEKSFIEFQFVLQQAVCFSPKFTLDQTGKVQLHGVQQRKHLNWDEMQLVKQTLLNLTQLGGDGEPTSCECVNGLEFV